MCFHLSGIHARKNTGFHGCCWIHLSLLITNPLHRSQRNGNTSPIQFLTIGCVVFEAWGRESFCGFMGLPEVILVTTSFTGTQPRTVRQTKCCRLFHGNLGRKWDGITWPWQEWWQWGISLRRSEQQRVSVRLSIACVSWKGFTAFRKGSKMKQNPQSKGCEFGKKGKWCQ